jgi:hypothetical protein
MSFVDNMSCFSLHEKKVVYLPLLTQKLWRTLCSYLHHWKNINKKLPHFPKYIFILIGRPQQSSEEIFKLYFQLMVPLVWVQNDKFKKWYEQLKEMEPYPRWKTKYTTNISLIHVF